MRTQLTSVLDVGCLSDGLLKLGRTVCPVGEPLRKSAACPALAQPTPPSPVQSDDAGTGEQDSTATDTNAPSTPGSQNETEIIRHYDVGPVKPADSDPGCTTCADGELLSYGACSASPQQQWFFNRNTG